MKFIFIIIILIGFLNSAKSQDCFDNYDLLFVEENESLPYSEFHKLELNFLESINGCNAIDFSVVTIDGDEIILSSLKGKVVVLNFWFTTCLPCLKEIPELNRLVSQFDADEVVFIGLARDNKEKLDNFFKRFGSFDYQIIPGSYDIADDYNVIGWPQSMVIDKNGRVYKSWAGLSESPVKLRKQIGKTIEECLLLD